jgi:hypothetical protein
MREELTTISVTRELVERLKALGRKGDRYEDIIRKLLQAHGGPQEMGAK